MHRYPQATEVTLDVALEVLETQSELIDKAAECSALWQGLSVAARKAAEEAAPDWPSVKALWLVADACSMMLEGESTNDPFKPLAVFSHGRSAVPGDFERDDYALFSEISKSVKNRILRARFSDLAWIGLRPKNVEDARRAIDAYIEAPLNEETWPISQTEWRRAVTLCRQLRKGAEGRLKRIEQELEHTAETALELNGNLGRSVARMLFDCRLGGASGRRFADLLAIKGSSLLALGSDLWDARAYFNLAAQWYQRLDDSDRSADMTVQIAFSFEADADQRIASDPQTGHLVAQSFLEDAIQTLRTVQKDKRALRNIDEEILRLSLRLTDVGERVVQSFATIKSGATDISELVEQAIKAVKGKEPLEALLELSHLHPGANLAQLTQYAEESLRDFAFTRLFAASHISRDGRVIAKTPGGGFDEAADEHREKVFGTVMQHYRNEINLVCQAQIARALGVLIQEQTIRKDDLLQLMSSAPIVPPGRANQFAKGLWEGFEGDFASAIYLLAPQVEHLARWHLKKSGATTTHLDKNGIETELGLSTLVDMPELASIFGENTVFEIRALFCTALGPNFRNEVAHGLLSADDGHSVESVYAWWWVLQLTLRSFVRSRRGAS